MLDGPNGFWASWLRAGSRLGIGPLVKLRQPINRWWTLAFGAASILLLISFYTYISHRQHERNPDDRTLPLWGTIFTEGVIKSMGYDVEERDSVDLEKHPDAISFGADHLLVPKKDGFWGSWFWKDFKATYYRLLYGMLIGVGAAVVVGVLMGCFGAVEAFFFPPLSMLAKVPPTAMLAVFFVMVGTGYEMFLTMIAFGIFPTLALSIYHAAKDDVPEELLYKAATLGASPMERILNVIVPNIFPKFLDALRLAIGPAMVYLIAAELLVADVGFGFRMKLQQRLLDMPVVYFYIVFLAVSGYLLDRLVMWIRIEACPWYGASENHRLILRPLFRRVYRWAFPWYPYPAEDKVEAKPRA